MGWGKALGAAGSGGQIGGALIGSDAAPDDAVAGQDQLALLSAFRHQMQGIGGPGHAPLALKEFLERHPDMGYAMGGNRVDGGPESPALRIEVNPWGRVRGIDES